MKQAILFFISLLTITGTVAQTLDEIKRTKKIRAAFSDNAKRDINYRLAVEFARYLDVELVPVSTTWSENFSLNGETPPDLKTNPNLSYTPDALRKADIVCNTIYVMDWRKKFFDYAVIYQSVDLLLTRDDTTKPKTYEDLKGRTVAFIENSYYETRIKEIDEMIGGGIKLRRTKTDIEPQRLLISGKVDAIVQGVNNSVKFLQRHPKFTIAFPIAPKVNAGWAVKKNNTELKKEIENFFEVIKGNGVLDKIFYEQYGINYHTFIDIININSELRISEHRDLDEIIESNKLKVGLRVADMVYSKTGKKQLCHALAESFAQFIGVELDITIVPYFSDYFKNENGRIIRNKAYTPQIFNEFDIACDIISELEWRKSKMDIIGFLPDAQVVVGRRETEIQSISDLRKYKGTTVKGTIYEDVLNKHNIENYEFSTINNLLSDVADKNADYTLFSNAIYIIPQYPELDAKFIIGDLGRKGWALSKSQPKLKQKLLTFFDNAQKSGLLNRLFEDQTGMTLSVAEKYLTVLHETSQAGQFPFVSYGAENGLPQENVLSIFQDNDSYLWFGTYSGAVKYTGKEMKIINSQNGLNDNIVNDINQDSDNNIYFATSKGVSILSHEKIHTVFPHTSFMHIYIDKSDNKWLSGKDGIYMISKTGEKIYYNKTNFGVPKYIQSLTKDQQGDNLYIASSKGLYRMNLNNNKVDKLVDEFCNFVFTDRDNNLWFSTNNELFLAPLNKANVRFKKRKLNNGLQIPPVTIKTVIQTKDGSIWAISEYKVFQILAINQKAISYDQSIGLKNTSILSIFEDREDNMWFGFSGGIQKLTNKSLRNFYPDEINGYVYSVLEDANGRIWISTKNGIYYYKEKLIDITGTVSENRATCIAAIMPNKNILIANIHGYTELDVNTLDVVDRRQFKNNLPQLEGLFISSKGQLFLMTGQEGKIYYFENPDAEPLICENNSTSLVYQLLEYDNRILGANNTGLVIFTENKFEKLIDIDSTLWTLCKDADTLWIGTERGLGKSVHNQFSYIKSKISAKAIKSILPANASDHLWLGTTRGFMYYNKNTRQSEFTIDTKDGLSGNEIVINGIFRDSRDLIWIPTFHGLTTFDLRKRRINKAVPKSNIEKVWINGIQVKKLPEKLRYNQNNLIFELTGISFKDEQSIEYDFYMRGLENDYPASKGKEYKAHYAGLPPGKYEFVYRTKNKDGLWGYYNSIEFEILSPFWTRWWFILLIASLLILSVYGIVRWRLYALHQKNVILEETVQKRTAELHKQADNLKRANEEITLQKETIEKNHRKITDSINYASKIQTAVLPPEEVLKKGLKQHFILFLPRDIVSGDFYWMKKIDNKVVVVAADCTGHGVPGAFMSLLGVSFLNEIANYSDMKRANHVLNELRVQVKKSLQQTGQASKAKDGMDIALCIIDLETKIVQYSGAHNPLFIISKRHENPLAARNLPEDTRYTLFQEGNVELVEIKGDKMPIGIYYREKASFTNHQIQLLEDDTIYLFSDGYADQFGGQVGDKYMAGNFKKLLVSIFNKPMPEQKQILLKTLENWKGGNYKQIDDILVIGIRL